MIANASAHALPFRDGAFHLVLGSPPYWGGIRQYHGDQGLDWPAVSYSAMPGLPPVEIPAQRVALGHEPDPFAYIGHLLLIYRECWRVLRGDGVCVVNMGDVYATGAGGCHDAGGGWQGAKWTGAESPRNRQPITGLRPKNLLLMPQRLALAMQADGWILRSRMSGGQDMRPDVIWRSNKMPESVRDRPSKDYEDVLIFAKAARYAWDQEAGRERVNGTAHDRGAGGNPKAGEPGIRHNASFCSAVTKTVSARNMRAAWTFADAIERAPFRELWDIPSEPTSAEHWAAWPEMLAARLIAVGTSERGCCPACGAGWERVVERGLTMTAERRAAGEAPRQGSKAEPIVISGPLRAKWKANNPDTMKGWRPGCSCIRGVCPDVPLRADQWEQVAQMAAEHFAPRPCCVLDPFTGIGRTWQAARRLGRRFVGVDLGLGYCLTARRRNAGGLPVVKPKEKGQASLFEAGVG